MTTHASHDTAEQPETFGPNPETFAFIVLSGLPLAMTITWSCIIRVRAGAELLGGRTYPPYLMEIVASDRQEPVILNLKMFSRRGLARLATLLSERASNAQLDKATTHLAKGRVPSVLFKNRRKGAV